ncbi:SusD/RagB family nutrient-binding outer membrane lipoprotein [Chitinophaga silvisoli]|uniref:SusD/RagB family nutrient-binding outer membrane lipoprotein n=1 Tax=Chitinophaga silvisoli TaxID=2291814 RepID=UPI00131488D3|nr:SusD/RagB family nutrient-binding outer membrane lipoprotein [Chitinophaga silvisoli]
MFNHIEAWIDRKRSGYLELTPVVYSNNFANGTISKRIPYQSGEKTANVTNYDAAVALLGGGDNYTSRMWWDVAQ